MENHNIFKLKPIAMVKNDIAQLGYHDTKEVVSDIIFDNQYEEALDSLEKFSHAVILFWFHKSTPWDNSVSKVHPRKRQDLPLVGVFSSRSPVRPNPIGMTVVKLLKREGNVLQVMGLDAIDGTPVLDIKPHFPSEIEAEIKVPDWVHQLRRDDRK